MAMSVFPRICRCILYTILISYAISTRIRRRTTGLLTSPDITYCPISAFSIDTRVSGLLGYPADVFDHELHDLFINSTINTLNSSESAALVAKLYGIDDEDVIAELAEFPLDNNFFRCKSSDRTNLIHNCSSLTRCPIRRDLLHAASQRMQNWSAYHSLCSLQEYLHDPAETINIFVLGGSVTDGAATFGCCCDHLLEPKCPITSKETYCGNGDTAILCRWSNLFAHFLSSKTAATVRLHNMARGGTTSWHSGETFSERLRNELGVTKLSSRDIVFIDHSVNDALAFFGDKSARDKATFEKLKRGLENLIRHIYHNADNGSWPSVILLEQWPKTVLGEYEDLYTEVAKRYNVTLWSYRDLVIYESQRLSLNPTLDATSLPFLSFEKNVEFGYQHPPSFIHLYYADMIAALFLRELRLCSDLRKHQRLGIPPPPSTFLLHSHSHNRTEEEMMIASLPTSSHDDVYSCDDSKPLLSMSASLVLRNQIWSDITNTGLIGTFSASPNGSWRVYEDRVGKPGWIDEFEQPATDGSDIRNLTFAFTDPQLLFSTKAFLLKVFFLRTYKNAGRVSVYLCGRKVGETEEFDALYPDFLNYRFSVEELVHVAYHADIDDYCDTKKRLEANDTTTPYLLEFRHTNIDFESMYSGIYPQPYLQDYLHARQHQKWKLTSVKICAFHST